MFAFRCWYIQKHYSFLFIVDQLEAPNIWNPHRVVTTKRLRHYSSAAMTRLHLWTIVYWAADIILVKIQLLCVNALQSFDHDRNLSLLKLIIWLETQKYFKDKYSFNSRNFGLVSVQRFNFGRNRTEPKHLKSAETRTEPNRNRISVGS